MSHLGGPPIWAFNLLFAAQMVVLGFGLGIIAMTIPWRWPPWRRVRGPGLTYAHLDAALKRQTAEALERNAAASAALGETIERMRPAPPVDRHAFIRRGL